MNIASSAASRSPGGWPHRQAGFHLQPPRPAGVEPHHAHGVDFYREDRDLVLMDVGYCSDIHCMDKLWEKLDKSAPVTKRPPPFETPCTWWYSPSAQLVGSSKWR